MKYLKSYKLFEELASIPVKRFPTEPAIHFNYLVEILESAGIDMYRKGKESNSFFDFCFKKCSKEILFPNRKDNVCWDDSRYDEFIFGESIFLIPESYDSSGDAEEAIQKKKNFLDKMRDFAKEMGKSKVEQDKFVEDTEKHTKFGSSSFESNNIALKVIHDKLGQYYKGDKLRVWFPKDRDYEPWIGMDYPHKYEYDCRVEAHPNGVYYLSDIEKYIEYKYDIKDDLFYKFIIDNQYIEGRYWERVWSLSTEDKNGKDMGNKLQKSGFGNYGMEPTENILHILNIIEKDFDIKSTECNGFPIYIDYYKKIESK